jgi:addiction module HigA family antidote
MSLNQYTPDMPSPPGDSLADILEERNMSQAELAARLGRSEKTISEIIQGIAPITPDIAAGLELVLGAPARFWNERERRYREHLASHKEYDSVSKQD